ncbi:MAG: hypothetical protein K6G07_02395 [Lachnospiraceae bacterium]|nr:hypothetical protein [Lachnospiraceae bacterium]
MTSVKQPENRTMKGKITGGRRVGTRLLALFLSVTVLLPALFLSSDREINSASKRKLTLSAAKSVAVANSDKILSLEMQIEAKTAARTSAIRSLKEKERNMSTFRWSPLLNFSFPTDPNEAEAFEFAYKPIQLQYNIDTLNHKIDDAKLAEYEKVSNIYIDIITSQAEISFLKSRITNMEIAVLKNTARVAEGTATQAQVDLQNQKLESMKSALSSEQTKLLRAQQKLGKEIGFSVTSGYIFEEAYIGMDIDENTVESLQAYALGKDQTVYEAKQAMDLAQIALSTNYELMKSQYGNNIGMISGYIQQAMDGQKIDKRAFKKDYDAFLKKIDEPWQGKKRILFFKFPKEWWKGDIDGIRYVEDDPYVLYSSALEYEGAITDYNNAVQELYDAISDGYDSYIEARKAYISAQTDLATQKENLINAEAQNALGQMSLEEYETIRSEYESSRSALKASLQTYSSLLNSFDKTTCGAASAYFVEESLSTQTGAAGLGTPPDDGSGVDDDLNRLNAVIAKGATYSIRSIVDSQEFLLFIDIPSDFEYPVTDFELWADGRQIGERTPVGDSLRHLRLTLESVDTVFVRLYNGTEFFDDCSIDPTASYGPLLIRTGYEEEDKSALPVIGTFTVEDDTNTDMIKLRFTFDQNAVKKEYQLGTDVAFYNLSAERNLYLFSNDLVAQEDPFNYMSFIKGDLDKLTIRLFDEQGSYIGGAKFNSNTNSLYVDEDVTLTDMQEIAARELVIDKKTEELQKELRKQKDLLLAAQNSNSKEEDTATITYYKDRVADLEAKIASVEADVTAEDIAEAIAKYPDELQERVSAMSIDPDTGEATEETGMSAEEEEARAAILEEAAKEYIRKSREEETREQVQNAITEAKKSLAEDYRAYQKALTDRDSAAAEVYKKKIEATQKAIDANTEKLGNLRLGDDISEEEIAKALREHGDEIYGSSAAKLSDDMIYGSEVGQWAVAYLEEQKLSVTPASIRAVVENAEMIPLYQKALERRDALTGEKEKAQAQMEKLLASGTTADKACAAQLKSIIDAYDKELKKLESDIHQYDPAKTAKIAEMTAMIEALEAERNRLISVQNPNYLTDAMAKVTEAEAIKEGALAVFDKSIADCNLTKSTNVAVIMGIDNKKWESVYTTLNQVSAWKEDHSRLLTQAKASYNQAVADGKTGNYLKVYKNKIEQEEKIVASYSKKESELQDLVRTAQSFAALRERTEYKAKLNSENDEMLSKIKSLEDQKKSAEIAYNEMIEQKKREYEERKTAWNTSEARRKEIDAQIKRLKAEIDTYR